MTIWHEDRGQKKTFAVSVTMIVLHSLTLLVRQSGSVSLDEVRSCHGKTI